MSWWNGHCSGHLARGDLVMSVYDDVPCRSDSQLLLLSSAKGNWALGRHSLKLRKKLGVISWHESLKKTLWNSTKVNPDCSNCIPGYWENLSKRKKNCSTAIAIFLEWGDNGGKRHWKWEDRDLWRMTEPAKLPSLFNEVGSGWRKLWFVEPNETLVCMDHKDILAVLPLMLSAFFKKAPELFKYFSQIMFVFNLMSTV